MRFTELGGDTAVGDSLWSHLFNPAGQFVTSVSGCVLLPSAQTTPTQGGVNQIRGMHDWP